jgi:hypothetical protein
MWPSIHLPRSHSVMHNHQCFGHHAVIAPDGFPLRVSVSEPGSVHDITAARILALPALYRAAATGLPTFADPGER